MLSMYFGILVARSKWRALSQYFVAPSLSNRFGSMSRDASQPSAVPATSPYNVDGVNLEDQTEDPLLFRRQLVRESVAAGEYVPLPATHIDVPEGAAGDVHRSPGSVKRASSPSESNSGPRAPEHGAAWSYFASLPLPSLPKLFPGRRSSALICCSRSFYLLEYCVYLL